MPIYLKSPSKCCSIIDLFNRLLGKDQLEIPNLKPLQAAAPKYRLRLKLIARLTLSLRFRPDDSSPSFFSSSLWTLWRTFSGFYRGHTLLNIKFFQRSFECDHLDTRPKCDIFFHPESFTSTQNNERHATWSSKWDFIGNISGQLSSLKPQGLLG